MRKFVIIWTGRPSLMSEINGEAQHTKCLGPDIATWLLFVLRKVTPSLVASVSHLYKVGQLSQMISKIICYPQRIISAF